MLLTFNSFDVQKVHNTICNGRSSANMATGRVYVQLHLLLQHQPFRKDGIRNYQTYATLRFLTLLSPIYAKVFQEISSVEVLRPKCWIEFLIPCIRFTCRLYSTPFDIMNLII